VKHETRLFRPSWHTFLREAKHVPHFSFFDRLHAYVYLRWPYLYIGIGTGQHWLTRWLGPLVGWLTRVMPNKRGGNRDRVTFADTYHGKVVPLEAASQLVTIKEDVSLVDLEQIVPYALARDIVLQHPDHIVVLECPCRASRPNPCQPLDVCLIVGEPFASVAADHHPDRSRWITPQEAVEILRAEDERGHVHHAFFKDAMLGRFYAICNCCACCCGAMQAWRHGTPMLASSGYTSRVDANLCIGCGTCSPFCQFGALSMNNGTAAVDTTVCMGCGTCVSKCAEGALSLVRDPTKGQPLEIRELIASASSALLD
jgi:ferredoxin